MSIWVEELKTFLTEEEYRRYREQKGLEKEKEKLKAVVREVLADVLVDVLTNKLQLVIDLKNYTIVVKKVG
jgi:hypothetical protein